MNGARSSRPGLAELGRALRSGELTATALLEESLAAIQRSSEDDSPLNCFVSLAEEAARQDAQAADRALENGRDPGPLAGIPVALKDNICVRGLPTSCASRILDGYVSPFEATVTRKLRAAGAVIVGKTNLDEFAMGSSSENSAFGPVRNPIDRRRVAGGSSGGSAAAVAAGLVPLALGSDTGGSIRQPAALCGVVGTKPTYGRVSRYGLVAFASSFDQIGPITRSVEDACIARAAIAGRDERDSTSAEVSVPDFVAGLDDDARGLVVGVPREYMGEELDPRIADLCRSATERLSERGVEIREVSLPHTRYAIPAYYLIANAEASSNLARYDGVRYGLRDERAESTRDVYRLTRGGGFGTEVKRRIMLGTYGLSSGYYEAYYGRGQRVRRLIRQDFDQVFASGVDVLFTPTSPTAAFPIGERIDDPVRMYLSDIFTVTANLTGLPAISIPIGDVDGLPAGGQFIAHSFEERLMLRAAAELERALSLNDDAREGAG